MILSGWTNREPSYRGLHLLMNCDSVRSGWRAVPTHAGRQFSIMFMSFIFVWLENKSILVSELSFNQKLMTGRYSRGCFVCFCYQIEQKLDEQINRLNHFPPVAAARFLFAKKQIGWTRTEAFASHTHTSPRILNIIFLAETRVKKKTHGKFNWQKGLLKNHEFTRQQTNSRNRNRIW